MSEHKLPRKLEFTDIDPYNCTIEELKAEITRLHDMVDFYESKQLANKRFINSIYGACASQFFVANNVRVAESITLQGQDLNHFSENTVNTYFCGPFQNDTELHKKLGIKTEDAQRVTLEQGIGMLTPQPPCTGKVFSYLKNKWTLTCAGDTDSIYVEFGRITRQLHIPADKEAEFIVTLWEEGMQPYMNKAYEWYAQYYHCGQNKQNLELEKIARTTILLAKKHYAMDESWKEPDIYLNPLDEVNYKGIELVQGSTPRYVKKCLDHFYRYILGWYATHDEKPKYEDLVALVHEYKEKYEIQNPDDICNGTNISEYNTYVLDDMNSLVFKEGAPIHARAAGFYNYMLNNKYKQYKNKYNTIQNTKIKWYYVKGSDDPFGYLPNSFPIEFAPPIDYELMFNKTILAKINKVMESIGMNQISTSMTWVNALF